MNRTKKTCILLLNSNFKIFTNNNNSEEYYIHLKAKKQREIFSFLNYFKIK